MLCQENKKLNKEKHIKVSFYRDYNVREEENILFWQFY